MLRHSWDTSDDKMEQHRQEQKEELGACSMDTTQTAELNFGDIVRQHEYVKAFLVLKIWIIVVVQSLQKATNVTYHRPLVDRNVRSKMMGRGRFRGCTLWLTGNIVIKNELKNCNFMFIME